MLTRSWWRLSTIYVHCWQSFIDQRFEIRGNHYLGGKSGAGKTVLIDAIQLPLIADLRMIRFNCAAQDGLTTNERKLEDYVRHRSSTGIFLRSGDVVSYIALEFTTNDQQKHLVVGVSIEARGSRLKKVHFLLSEPLDTTLFLAADGSSRTHAQLEATLTGKPASHFYPRTEDYQEALLSHLGGFGPVFFDHLLRALALRPVSQLGQFIEEWILPTRPITIKPLQQVYLKWHELGQVVQETCDQVQRLSQLTQHQQHLRNQEADQERMQLQTRFLRLYLARQHLQINEQQTQQCEGEIREAHKELEQLAQQKAQLESHFQVLYRQQAQLTHAQEQQNNYHLQRNALEQQMSILQNTWTRLRQQIQKSLSQWQHISMDPLLPSELQAHFHVWIQEKEQLLPLPPPPLPNLLERLRSVFLLVQHLDTELTGEQGAAYNEEKSVTMRLKVLKGQFREQSSLLLHIPPALETLRKHLEGDFSFQCWWLHEFLEIPEGRWQGVIESLLDPVKWHLLIPSHLLQPAWKLVHDWERHGSERLGLLALEAYQSTRDMKLGNVALAMCVQVKPLAPFWTPYIRAYLDDLLGAIILCEQEEELWEHANAVTADQVLKTPEGIRQLISLPTTWVIGTRAAESHRAALQQEIAQSTAQLTAIQLHLDHLDKLRQALDVEKIREHINSLTYTPLDPFPLQKEIREIECQLQDVTKQLRETEQDLEQSRERQGMLAKQCAFWEKHLTAAQESHEHLLEDRQHLHSQVRILEEEVSPVRMTTSREEVAHAEAAVSSLIRQSASAQNALVVLQATQERQERTMQQTINDFVLAERDYLREMQIVNPGVPGDPHTPSYQEEQHRLEDLQLPHHRQALAEQERVAKEHIQQHLFHQLCAHIDEAERRLREITRLLGETTFHGSRYKFRFAPAPQWIDFYHLIMEARTMLHARMVPPLPEEARQRILTDFFQLFGQVTDLSKVSETHPMLDYRQYLHYEFVQTRPDDQEVILNKEIDLFSGGEKQTPMYVLMAVSFLELYRASEQSGTPSIRLVILDEAFNRMDQGFIHATLEVFRRFGLQLLIATPPERFPYIRPFMDSAVMFVKQSDTIHPLFVDLHTPPSPEEGFET